MCESKNDLPHPIAVITQRDVMRLLLVFLGETLQVRKERGELRKRDGRAPMSASPRGVSPSPSLSSLCALVLQGEIRVATA